MPMEPYALNSVTPQLIRQMTPVIPINRAARNARAAGAARASRLRGLGDDEMWGASYGDSVRGALVDPASAGFDFQQLIDQIPQTLVQLYQAGRQAEMQDQLLSLNIQRAQRGLSPISLNQIGGAALVGPQVGVSLDPETKKLITYGVVGGLGLLALSMFRGASRSRRRR